MRRLSAFAAMLGGAILLVSVPHSPAAATSAPAAARAPAHAKIRVDAITVHSRSIEGNLEGNSADRKVFVVLPPGYERARGKRYPVIYFLHGFDARPDAIAGLAEAALTRQGAAEMIIVLPDGYTRHGGSMYSSSPTVGDFEDFVARELVAFIDSRYRTIARRESRGLAGHSMGGYGTLRIGMKHPGVFSALYAMSACCIRPPAIRPAFSKQLEEMTVEQAAKANFLTRVGIASAAAWSPAPDKPPLYLDGGTTKGVVDPLVEARWAANVLLAMLPQYVGALKRMTAIGLEVGDKDFLLRDDTAMHDSLTRYGIRHDWQVFQGDHTNRFDQRFVTNIVPFFARNLKGKR